MDQDKGWTLLNRGTVIGNIHFNIRNLLIGLSMDSDSDIYSKLKKVDEMKKVQKESRAILRLIDFSEQRVKYPNDIENDMDMEKKLKALKMVRNVLNRKIKKLKNQINNDKSVLNYIDAMQLSIEHNGEVIPVTKKNLIVSQDNINFLVQQLSFLERELINTNYEIRLVKEKLVKETETLFENKDDKILDSVMAEFQNMNIKVNIIESKIDDLEEKIRSEDSDIDRMFLKNNVLVKETTEWIKIFAKKLGVLDIVDQNKYLFTRDLKSISGTIYYKVVFAFKMAYIKVIEDTMDENLPIVLDSPSGREVTGRNISIVIDILNEFFKNNQIIIASIKEYDIHNLTEIRIINNLMEENNIK